MDTREIKFLEFNEDKLMQNLLEAEEHARIASNTSNPGHISCIVKHTILAEGHSNEGISHALNSPYKTQIFKEVGVSVSNFRHDIMSNGFDQKKALEELRNIRKKAELLNPAFNTNDCRACSVGNPNSSNVLNLAKGLNTENNSNPFINISEINNNIGGKKMGLSMQELGVLTAGVFAGKFATWGTYEIDKMVLKSATSTDPVDVQIANTAIYKRPSVYINVLGGLGLAIGSFFLFKKRPALQLFMAATGAGLLTKSVDYLREAIGGKYDAGTVSYPVLATTPKVFIPAMPVRPSNRMGRSRIQVV
jgi:hypothetical protein